MIQIRIARAAVAVALCLYCLPVLAYVGPGAGLGVLGHQRHCRLDRRSGFWTS